MPNHAPYPDELRERAVRRVLDHQDEYGSQWEAINEAMVAFLGAGPTMLAVRGSGEDEVAAALRDGLEPFVRDNGSLALPGTYRAVVASVS